MRGTLPKLNKREFTHLVVDIETGLILIGVASASCASAVTLGLLNSMQFSLPVQFLEKRGNRNRFDFNKDLYQLILGVEIRRFPKRLARKGLMRKRRLAKLRAEYISALEIYFEQELHRVAEYMPEHLAAYIHSELDYCDPARSHFTRPIEEYAALQEIEVQAAYQELQLKLQSSGMVRLRNYALYEKYMMRMNTCESAPELDAVLKDALDAMLCNAMI